MFELLLANYKEHANRITSFKRNVLPLHRQFHCMEMFCNFQHGNILFTSKKSACHSPSAFTCLRNRILLNICLLAYHFLFLFILLNCMCTYKTLKPKSQLSFHNITTHLIFTKCIISFSIPFIKLGKRQSKKRIL